MRKTKAKLITTLSIALLSVFTMGVSTFAWFQAQANVNIETESTSTTITVAKPDDYSFYAYKGNGNDLYTNENAEVAPDSSSPNSDFEQIMSGDPASSVAGLGPGQSALFCVKLLNKTNPSLKIKSLISNNTTKQNSAIAKKIAGSGDPGRLINIGWAIDIYTTHTTTGLGYRSFLTTPTGGDKFIYSDQNETLYTGYTLSSGSNAEQTITLPDNHEKTIFSLSDDTEYPTLYVFYMVHFSEAEATRYKELEADNPSAQEATCIPATAKTTKKRYFVQSDSGNSNCYGGLTFALTKLLIV